MVGILKTRGHSLKLRLDIEKVHIFVTHRVVDFGNGVAEVVESNTISTFKSHIRKYLNSQNIEDTILMLQNWISKDGHNGCHGSDQPFLCCNSMTNAGIDRGTLNRVGVESKFSKDTARKQALH